MNSLAALTLLLQRAEADRDTASAVLRQAEAQMQQALAQAAQLERYRGDCDQRLALRFREPGTTALLHCHRDFGQRLTSAIAQQHTEAGHLGNRVQLAKNALLERERRVAAVQKLMARRRAEMQRMADRRDQRATDEAAQRTRPLPPQGSALSS